MIELLPYWQAGYRALESRLAADTSCPGLPSIWKRLWRSSSVWRQTWWRMRAHPCSKHVSLRWTSTDLHRQRQQKRQGFKWLCTDGFRRTLYSFIYTATATKRDLRRKGTRKGKWAVKRTDLQYPTAAVWWLPGPTSGQASEQNQLSTQTFFFSNVAKFHLVESSSILIIQSDASFACCSKHVTHDQNSCSKKRVTSL